MGLEAGLKDRFHRPKEPVIGLEDKAWVVHLASTKPKDPGYAAELWTRQALADHVRHLAVSTKRLSPLGRCFGNRLSRFASGRLAFCQQAARRGAIAR